MRSPHVFVVAAVAAFVLVLSEPVVLNVAAWAHHSGAGFSPDKVIELTGTVKEFQFTNPHTWIQVMVDGPKGEKVEWSIEWGSPNQLGRQGVRPSTFPAGATVTMRLRPMLNGAPAGAFVGAKFADGKTVGRWE